MKGLKIVKKVSDANFITHSGKFHIDDVFSTVFLTKYFEDVKLKRVNNIQETYKNNIIMYDIGLGKFDHHQSNAMRREDGIIYSSFGLLWKEYGKKFLQKLKCRDVSFVWKKFDNNFVKTIDKIDNFQIEPENKNTYLISNIIENFNPLWNSNYDSDLCFIRAVNFANKIFNNELKNIISIAEAKEILKKRYKTINYNFIILEKYIPYQDFILENDKEKKIQFVIYPSKRNGIEVRTVFDRKKFPVIWHDMNEEEFYKNYGIKGMLYCHSNGKLCIVQNEEIAKSIIRLT